MKKLLVKSSSLLAFFGLMMTVFSVNSACMGYVHQPEVPNTAKKLRKF